MAMATPDLEAKFLGAMIGGALGDAIGELAFSLTDASALDAGIAEADVLVYTDDTAMALGLAESLIACGAVEPQALGRAFHENFRREPWRGYGPGPPSLFASVEREGLRYADAARALYGGEGSFGNGAAMRVAPVGLLFHAAPGLDSNARASAEVTHAHPLGADGAAVQAAAVAQAVGQDPTRPLAVDSFCDRLIQVARTPEVGGRMALVRELVARSVPPHRAADAIGRSIAVHESMPFALYAFLTHPGSFAECLRCAVLHGGDRDTLGAMACAISGARLGIDAVPAAWIARLENRDLIEDLARRLAALCS